MARRFRARRPLVPLVAAVVLASTVLATVPAGADDVPSLRLLAARSEVTVERDGNGSVYLDPGVWITPVGGDFELRVGRVDYESPITITQVDSATGAALRFSNPAEGGAEVAIRWKRATLEAGSEKEAA